MKSGVPVWVLIWAMICCLGIGFSSAMTIVQNCFDSGKTLQSNSIHICKG